jgi:hypothetical protein
MTIVCYIAASAETRTSVAEPDGGLARPDAGKEGQWPGLVEGEPNRRTGAVREHLILGKNSSRAPPAWAPAACGRSPAERSGEVVEDGPDRKTDGVGRPT